MGTPMDNALLDHLIAEVIAHSSRRVEEGGIPFAALVVDHEGEILGRGVNLAEADHDPIAHAEVVVIRDACRHRKSVHLHDSLLIASGEPCALCYVAALYAGIGEVVFAADREEAAKGGFDYRSSYHLLNRDPAAWPLKCRHYRHAGSARPFKTWREIHRDEPSVIPELP